MHTLLCQNVPEIMARTVENEIHFMTCCTLYMYSDRKNRLYQGLNVIGNRNWLSCNTNEKKFYYLLQPKDTHTSKLEIAYILYIFVLTILQNVQLIRFDTRML